MSEKKIIEIQNFLKKETIKKTVNKSKKNFTINQNDVKQKILELIKRRPATVKDISLALKLREVEINKYIKQLEKEKIIEFENLKRGLFIKKREG